MSTAGATVDALRRAAEVGPFFTLAVGIDDGPWLPFGDLLDPSVLAENVAVVQRSLGAADVRAAGSTYFLGIASRLMSPVLGAAALGGQVPIIDLDALWRQAGSSGPFALSSVAGTSVADPTEAAAAIHRGVIEPVLTPLAAAFQETFGLSDHVLWGNVASATAGSAIVLPGALPIAREVTASGRLSSMGDWTNGSFTRRNCCLIYRIPRHGKCGDCVLN